MDEIFWSSGYIKMEMGLSLNALIHRRNSAVVAVGGPFDGSPLFHKSNSKFQNSRGERDRPQKRERTERLIYRNGA